MLEGCRPRPLSECAKTRAQICEPCGQRPLARCRFDCAPDHKCPPIEICALAPPYPHASGAKLARLFPGSGRGRKWEQWGSSRQPTALDDHHRRRWSTTTPPSANCRRAPVLQSPLDDGPAPDHPPHPVGSTPTNAYNRRALSRRC